MKKLNLAVITIFAFLVFSTKSIGQEVSVKSASLNNLFFCYHIDNGSKNGQYFIFDVVGPIDLNQKTILECVEKLKKSNPAKLNDDFFLLNATSMFSVINEQQTTCALFVNSEILVIRMQVRGTVVSFSESKFIIDCKIAIESALTKMIERSLKQKEIEEKPGFQKINNPL